jgi:hypothetical protein
VAAYLLRQVQCLIPSPVFCILCPAWKVSLCLQSRDAKQTRIGRGGEGAGQLPGRRHMAGAAPADQPAEGLHAIAVESGFGGVGVGGGACRHPSVCCCQAGACRTGAAKAAASSRLPANED